MFRKALLLFLILSQVIVAELVAAEENFAFSAKIGSGKQSIRQFELPYEVLHAVQQQDYSDIRIVNDQNQVVPFSVTVVKPKVQQHTNEHDLDFFTLPRNSQQHARLQIEIDRYIRYFNFSTGATNKDKHSYIIIKNFYSEQGLNKLKLVWKQFEPGFSLKLKLEQSDDLEHWKVIKQQSTLYKLKQSSTQLIKDSIYLSRKSYANYLRLSFTNRTDFLYAVKKIKGYSDQQNQAEFKNWKSQVLKQGEMENEWLFSTDSIIPVAQIAFEIPQTGLLYQGTLFSKSNLVSGRKAARNRTQFKKEVKKILQYPHRYKSKPNARWQYRQTFTQYRLLTESGEINAQSMSMSNPIKDRNWRIVLKQPLTLLPEQVPKIKIAWYPVVVTFLAQGDESYRLQFGRSKIKPLAIFHSLKTIANNQAETVSLGAIYAAEKPNANFGLESTMSSEFKNLNWAKILLWLLLCAFVFLMITMAYKLYLGMNKE